MKFATEMRSGCRDARINFHEDWSHIQKLIGRIPKYTDSMAIL
jgi:hypothetical protein